MKPILKRSIVNGIRITLVLLIGTLIVAYTPLRETSVSGVLSWLFTWPIIPFIRLIPRFDDPPLIGLLLTIATDLVVYSLLCFVVLFLWSRLRSQV